MHISGIRPYGAGYDYNQINRVSAVAPVEAVDTKPAEPVEEVSAVESSVDAAKIRANQTFDSYDYSTLYNPGEEFEMKGPENDLRTLDVEQAISDMQKDVLLHQYQYFVGENTSAAATPVIRGGEDFSL